jgi:hypothetical protein
LTPSAFIWQDLNNPFAKGNVNLAATRIRRGKGNPNNFQRDVTIERVKW